MVRKLMSQRWSGGNKHPQDDSPVVDRTYVDFGDNDESEAAVERWLTSPASQKFSPSNKMSRSRSNSSKALPTSNGKIRKFFNTSNHGSNSNNNNNNAPTTTTKMEIPSSPRKTKYSPTQGKRILRERLESRSKALGKNITPQSSTTVTATVTPTGIRDRISMKKSSPTSSSRNSSSTTSNNIGDGNVFSFNEIDDSTLDSHHHHHHPEMEEAFHNKLIVSVVSSDSSNGNALHPRRTIDNMNVDNNKNVVLSSAPTRMVLPRELPKPPATKSSSIQSIPPDDSPSDQAFAVSSNSSSSNGRPSVGRASTRRRPLDESAEDKKSFFGSSSSRRRSSSGEGSNSSSSGAGAAEAVDSRTTSADAKKNGFFGSRRKSLAESGVENVYTGEASKKNKTLGRQRSTESVQRSAPTASSPDRASVGSSTTTSSRTESSTYHSEQSRSQQSRSGGSLPSGSIDKYVMHMAEEAMRELDEEREKQDTTTKAQTTPQKQQQQQQQLSSSRQLAVPARTNRIKLNVYDLLHNEVVMQLPWGCQFPIGQCFNVLNSGLHNLGTGAYHVGVEINGVEYAYGANQTRGATGIFSCMPKHSPGYQFRTSIDFGERVLIRNILPSQRGDDIDGPRKRQVDGREVLREMTDDYLGMDYDLLRKNCCTFAHDACRRLGVKEEEIPSWFRNLCVAGALTQDAANSTFEPITQVFSACGDMDSPFDDVTMLDEEYVPGGHHHNNMASG